MKNHEKFMKKCLDLAILGLKKTLTNPLVGCVIVKNGKIIATGYHEKYGGPHAEVNAIKNLKNQYPKNYKQILSDSNLYVNLEPCAHFGKTPPCVELLLKYQIKKVIIGTLDPFKEVKGKSIEKLKKHTQVIVGVLPEECRKINYNYFINHEHKRPYIILKWAESKDGFINNLKKGSTKISCPESTILSHKWRSQVDGIMVGTNTVTCDNPELTTRKYPGKNPIRITIDRNNKLDSKDWNIKNKLSKTIILNEKENKVEKNITYLNYLNNGISNNSTNTEKLKNMMNMLYKNEIKSILIEGGAIIIQNMITLNLWDEARCFRSEKKITKGIKGPVLNCLKNAKKINSGNDVLLILYNNLFIKNNHSKRRSLI